MLQPLGEVEFKISFLVPLELAKKTLEICGKYDTLQEVYFEGQGYAPKDKKDKVERYHHNPNMWEYIRTTRIWVDDIFELPHRKIKASIRYRRSLQT